MATPTPMSNTPQKHLPVFSSPAPRSVPAMNFDSPATLGLLAEGGIGMGLSMSLSGLGLSSLGLTASAMGRADEDERRRRLESIIATLKSKPGRVSPQGILELCRREGLEVEQEKAALVLMIGTEGMCEIPVRNGEIVTDGVTLELNHDRHNYAATASRILADSLKPLPGMSKINLTLDRFALNLEKLLRMDKLSGPQNGGISCYQAIFGVYASLKKLFDHEKKMALALIDTDAPYASQKAEREVLCKKSGRPRINAGNCLGLSLEYWLDRRHLFAQKSPHAASPRGKDKMDIDSTSSDEYPEDDHPETHRIYSLTIECEASPSSMYSPIRVSDSWISDSIEKAPDATDTSVNNMANILLNKPTLDWLEPPPTYLPSAAPEGDHDAMNLDNAPGRLPNIRFVAKLNPPLVVPLTTYANFIMPMVNAQLDTNDIRATTFVGLALRPNETDPGNANLLPETTHQIHAEKAVLVASNDGKEEQKVHSNSLFVPKTEYARTIESIPFAHPRQLVEMLPLLRQYAFTSSLIQDTFGAPSQASDKKSAPHRDPLSPPETPKLASQSPTSLHVDVSLSYAHPIPRLTFEIPPTPPTSNLTSNSTSASAATDLLSSLLSQTEQRDPVIAVTLEVHPNADLVITQQNVVDVSNNSDGKKDEDRDVDMEQATQGFDDRVKRIAKALEICQDIGVWSEWVRRAVGDGEEASQG